MKTHLDLETLELAEAEIAMGICESPAITKIGRIGITVPWHMSKRRWFALRILDDHQKSRRLTQDATKGDIMRRAWFLARRSAGKFGGNSRQYLSETLKMAWAETKGNLGGA